MTIQHSNYIIINTYNWKIFVEYNFKLIKFPKFLDIKLNYLILKTFILYIYLIEVINHLKEYSNILL
jgi:hypothetical protein